jgi:hypothetical protein
MLEIITAESLNPQAVKSLTMALPSAPIARFPCSEALSTRTDHR